MPGGHPDQSALHRPLWRGLAWCCVGLGAVGAVLPVMPTTPFLLVAAWAAPKGSPRLRRWLESHPHFGPLLDDWRRERAIPRRAKYLAVIMLAISWLILWRLGMPAPALGLFAGLFLLVGCYLLSRPDPTPRRLSLNPENS